MSFSFISQVILLLIICKCHQFDPHDKALRILRIAFIFLITLRLVNNLFKKFVIINHLSRFVIVTAEYNCSLPPALTNLFDYFPPASFRQRVFVFFFLCSCLFSLCFVFAVVCFLKRDMFTAQQQAHLSLRHKPVSIRV